MWHDDSRFTVLASGSAKGTASGRRPRVRAYADPVTMLVLSAIDDAVDSVGVIDEPAVRAEVGVISISATGPQDTLSQLASAVSTGLMSPTRFAAAGPGFLAGLPCIDFGFRGPSLVLTCEPHTGSPVAAHVASSWLAHGGCRYVLVNEHRCAKGTHDVTTVLLEAAT